MRLVCRGENIYEHGLITITDTGSLYYSCSIGETHPFTGKYGASDGFTLHFQALYQIALLLLCKIC